MLQIYIYAGKKSVCVLCSLSSAIFFVGQKSTVYCFKDAILTFLIAKGGIKFAQDVT